MNPRHYQQFLFMSAVAASVCLFRVNAHGTVDGRTSVGTDAVMTWSEFRGEVTRVDQGQRVVQIREGSSDVLIEIPVNRNVSIHKEGLRTDLEDLRRGDRVIIRNNEAS